MRAVSELEYGFIGFPRLRKCVLFLAFLLVLSLPRGLAEDVSLSAIATLARQKRWSEAAAEIASYRQSRPDSVDAAILQSEILLHLGLLSDASASLDRILSSHPRSTEVLSAKAELSRSLGDKSTAEALLRRCSHYDPHSVEVWKQLGEFYLTYDRKEAIDCFQRAHAIAPGDAVAIAGLATAFHQQQQDSRAQSYFLMAEKLNKKSESVDATVPFLFAEFLQDRLQFEASLKQYDQAIQINPELLDARLGRAKSLIHLHQWRLAEEDLQLCLKDEQKKIATLNLLIKIAQAQGNNKDAQKYSAEATRLSVEQDNEKASNNQIASSLQSSHALVLKKRYPDAERSYETLTGEHPEVAEAWLGLGQCRVQTGDLDGAEQNLRQYLSLESKSAIGHVWLGRVLLRKNRTEDARAEFLQALQSDPLLSEAHLGIGASYVVDGQYPQAIAALRAAIALPDSGSDGRLMLAEALAKNHQIPEAREQLNRVLRVDPNNAAAKSMKSALAQENRAPIAR